MSSFCISYLQITMCVLLQNRFIHKNVSERIHIHISKYVWNFFLELMNFQKGSSYCQYLVTVQCIDKFFDRIFLPFLETSKVIGYCIVFSAVNRLIYSADII